MTYLKLVLVSLFWGGGFISGRMLMTGGVGPYSAAFARFIVATSLLFVVLYQTEKRLPVLSLRQWGVVALSGLCGIFLYNVLFFNGLTLVTASRASVIVAISPMVTALGSVVFFKETLKPMQWVGIVLALLGTILVVLRIDIITWLQENPASSGQPWYQTLTAGLSLGDLLIFGCVLTWVAYTLVGKVAVQTLSPLTITAYSSLVGCIGLGILAIPEGALHTYGSMSLKLWGCIVFMAVFSTVVAFNWFYQGVRAIGPSKTAVFGNLVPVFAVTLAVLILGEKVERSTLEGGFLVLLGIRMTSR